MKILVTGTAGFIGFHLAKKLLEHGYEDGVTEYFKLLQVNIDKNVHKEWYYGESEISNREDATPVLYLKRERFSEGKV